MYDESGADKHPTRIQIKETVRTNEGPMSAAEIARLYKMPPKRVAYHMRVLEQAKGLPPRTA